MEYCQPGTVLSILRDEYCVHIYMEIIKYLTKTKYVVSISARSREVVSI